MERHERLAECAAYTVECKTGNVFRRLPGFRDRKASEELGRNVERLAGLRASGEQPDAALTKWLDGQPAKLRDKLAGFELVTAGHRRRRNR